MTESESQAAPGGSEVTARQPTPPAALPDDQNPAMIDAQKTFAIIVISTALFIGAVVIFIL